MREYLIAKFSGVNPDRLVAVGLGETQLLEQTPPQTSMHAIVACRSSISVADGFRVDDPDATVRLGRPVEAEPRPTLPHTGEQPGLLPW